MRRLTYEHRALEGLWRTLAPAVQATAKGRPAELDATIGNTFAGAPNITVRSDAARVQQSTDAVIYELHVGTFTPEGTFKAEPGLLPFKNGAFLLAAKAGIPVVPVTIRGTRRLLGGGSVRFRWSAVEVDIAPPLPVGDHAAALRDAARAVVLARSIADPEHSSAILRASRQSIRERLGLPLPAREN